jgi:SNF2 family DNA or RNA helicase
MIYEPFPYQIHATEHILKNDFCGLFLDMGLGKTVTTLTAIRELLFDRMTFDKVLVIAPKRVAEMTWSEEVEKFDHLKKLRVSVVAGTAQQRERALQTTADVYTIGRDNVDWLVKKYGPNGRRWPFKFVVIDELSSFKNPNSKRFKALKKVRPKMTRLIGLTGTPAPNSLLNLWSQLYLIDRGERLGQTVTGYRQHYFYAAEGNGQIVYKWKARKGAEATISELISDVCISMKAKDYLTLPDRIDQIVNIELPYDLRVQYDTLEEELLLKLDPDTITAANVAGVLNKLAQFCNGAAYIATEDKSKVWRHIHDLKIEAVVEDVEALQGKPYLLFYQFQHDKQRLLHALKEFGIREFKTAKDKDDWNAGKIPVLLLHAASAGHGLNLQFGGSRLGWFGVPWDLELYLQAVARLDRQGQIEPVVNRRYLVRNSVEFLQLKALNEKGDIQDRLIDAVKALVMNYRKAA